MKPMTNEELEQIGKRAEAATPGPWWVGGDDEDSAFMRGNLVAYTDAGQLCRFALTAVNEYTEIPANRPEENKAFIAHARTDIPRLVAEVKHLRSLVHYDKLPPGFHPADDMTAALAVECASLDHEIERLRVDKARLLEACEGALNYMVKTHGRSIDLLMDVTEMTMEELELEIIGTSCERECLELYAAMQTAKGVENGG